MNGGTVRVKSQKLTLFHPKRVIGVWTVHQIGQCQQWLIWLHCDINNEVKMKKYFLNFVGMNTMEGVVMLASTNRQDILDQVKTQLTYLSSQSRRLKEML